MNLPDERPGAKLLIGLIGSGIGRSLTPAMHEEEARHHGLRVYDQLIDLEREQLGVEVLPSLLRAMRTIGFAGYNVTHPCKQAILPLLDDLSEDARAIGAVNTVVMRDGRVDRLQHGYLRMGVGFSPVVAGSRSFECGAARCRWRRCGDRARAHASRCRVVAIFDTEPTRAAALVDRLNRIYGHRARCVTDLPAALQAARGLVHATPTGMDHSPGLPLPAALLRPGYGFPRSSISRCRPSC